jgi:hypothetical protein
VKLPNFLESTILNELRTRMRADRLGDLRLVVDPNRLTEAELQLLVSGGLDVNSLDDVRVLPDGTLAFKDSRVILYIRDVSNYRSSHRQNVTDLPRFHFANCSTLQQMRSEHRFERYVVAARKDGLFEVNLIDNNAVTRSSPERLRVCQNCLGQIAFGGFTMNLPRAERIERVSAFHLEHFFKQYPRSLFIETPENRSDSSPLNVYPDNFEALSVRVRNERGWRCEGDGCGVVLADTHLRKYLHVHHKNGQKHDSREDNLELRCLYCHAAEPRHSHMRDLAEFDAFTSIRARLLQQRQPVRVRQHEYPQPTAERFSKETFFAFVREQRLDYEDYRQKQGALWVTIPSGKEHLVDVLRNWGFTFKEGRGWWRK